MLKLGVNIDHVATLRQARYARMPGAHHEEPSLLEAARECEAAGAHSITVHLREDRRHIQDRDVHLLRRELRVPLNFELGNTPEIIGIACALQPAFACMVPENRQEITTEGGLDVVRLRDEIEPSVRRLQAAGVRVSLFIDPDPDQVAAAAAVRADMIELHTGAYANETGALREAELTRLVAAGAQGHALGLQINAGHGITTGNLPPLKGIPYLTELNIGHHIVSRAVFTGLRAAVLEMLEAMGHADEVPVRQGQGAMVPVLIYSPMPLTSGKGNAVSALRIAGLLCQGGTGAAATDEPVTEEAEVLVVLNAWRSAAVALDWKRRRPARVLITVLTGTDIFPDFPSHPEVVKVLDAADAIVAWHDESAAQLPERFRVKTRVIYKSAPGVTADMPQRFTLPGPPARIDVLVVGHLREVKDPFRAAAAARLLPADSRLHILHAGEALTAGMAAQAAAESEHNPRYTWLGGIAWQDLWQRLRTAALTVNSSHAEGGANAVVESLRCGVPVLASRIPGNTGLLGRDWPGLFDTGDTAALAALLRRCEREPAFYADLLARTAARARHFIPEREQQGWLALLEELRG